MEPILIAEDEAPIRDLIRLTLEGAGYDCVCAADGDEAADRIEERDFALAVLDIMLPRIDGYELLRYLQSTGTPAIFVAARTAVADRVRGLRLGAEDYILKPFAPAELLARVETVLRRTGQGNRKLTAFGVELDPARPPGDLPGRRGAADPAGVCAAGTADAQPGDRAVPGCAV